MSITFIYPSALWLFLLIPLCVGLALIGPRRPTRARFWSGLLLRVVLLFLIILTLSGIQLRFPADVLTVVFLQDVSDSIPPEEQERGEAIIRQVVETMPQGDRAAVVVFGQDALVERLASEDRALPGLASVPLTARTGIAGALQLGLALVPDEGAKRLVLLSDGRENIGQAIEQAELATAHSVELTYIPLSGPQGEAEVLLESLDAPSEMREGQNINLSAHVRSTARIAGTLRVFSDGRLFHTQEVLLQTGSNRFLIPVERPEPGFHRFHAQIVPDLDTRLQNNEASAFTVVHGPPRVLLVQGQPGSEQAFVEALRAGEMDVTVVLPGEIPSTLPELASFDAVILANVPASSLPPISMETLPVYVRDLGKGLLMTGGEEAFGAGGYLRTPIEESLPVYMDVRSKDEMANLALVLAVDKSGSMGRCHCDDPDLSQAYDRREIGQPKVDIAKEAVMRAAGALGDQDYLGVVAFDQVARWAVEISSLSDFATLESSIGGIQATGQTNLVAGVEAAYDALETVEARNKHIILLTDGWVNIGDLTRLAREMQESGTTLSVVAAGGGSAEYLADLAESGGGRYYPAVDILRVPDFFLKETITAVGQYIIEEPFYPLPSALSRVMLGLNSAALPALWGYNGTTPKNSANIELYTPRGDPLLATWQYGLGRAAAWTSDLKGQWAKEWLAWDGFAQFVAQLVGWTLPAPQVEGLQASAALEEGQAVIRLEALDEDGRPRNFLEGVATLIDPNLQSTEIPLTQVGAGQYQATADVSKSGTYMVRLGVNQGDQSLGQQTLGLVVPYSPEYRTSGTDHLLLGELAGITGGSELAEPLDAFLHNLPATDRAREIWWTLLLVVAILFPLDVAVRRVMLGGADYRKGLSWLREKIPARQRETPAQERTLSQLFQARDRARHRRQRADLLPDHTPKEEQDIRAETPDSQPSDISSPHEDTLSRLRAAKKRARRGDD